MGNLCRSPTTTTKPRWLRQVEQDCQKLKRGDCKSFYARYHHHDLSDDDIHEDDELEYFAMLGEMLIGNTCLEELDLCPCLWNDQVSRSLGQGIGKSKLKQLWMQGPIRTLPSSSSEDNDDDKSVTECDVYQRFCDGLAHSQTLQEIMLVNFDMPGVSLITAILLSRVQVVQTMTIGATVLGVQGVAQVARSLGHNTTLTCLEFVECEMDDQGVCLLAEGIHSALPLQKLLLTRNLFGAAGLKRLMITLADHPTLETLKINENHKIGYQGLKVLGECLEANPESSRFLHVEACECVRWMEYEDSLAERIRHLAGQALLNAVKTNFRIKRLAVSCNGLARDHVNEMDFYIQLNSLGRHLLSMDYDLASTIWCHILSKCQQKGENALSLIYYFLREQPCLVQSRLS